MKLKVRNDRLSDDGCIGGQVKKEGDTGEAGILGGEIATSMGWAADTLSKQVTARRVLGMIATESGNYNATRRLYSPDRAKKGQGLRIRE